jgi:hypothetical protein
MMEPRRVLKALANGWQAPYPDEVVYSEGSSRATTTPVRELFSCR